MPFSAKCFIASMIMAAFLSTAHAANIYVDQTLSSDCTGGNYSIAKRNCSGSDGDAYNTIQKAVNAMRSGDDIFLRGGTYYLGGSGVVIPYTMSGSPDNWNSIQSYPGEWAILDGENNMSTRALLGYTSSGDSGPLSYWKFERLEFARADNVTENRATAIGIHHGPFIVRHCYFHDIGRAIANPGNNNGGAIRGSTWRDSIIEYNYFRNNRNPNTVYMSDICNFSDYVDNPASVDINNARRSNIIRYNIFEGGSEAVKFKAQQFLSLDHSGTHMTYKDKGDQIHHNIFINYNSRMQFWQDFVQVHHNIFDSCGEVCTTDPSTNFREFFHATFYNNLFKNTRLVFTRGSYSTSVRNYSVTGEFGLYHPYSYAFNNIFEAIYGKDRGILNLGIHFTWSSSTNWETHMNWSTVHIENNLFHGYGLNDKVITIANSKDYSVNDMEYLGRSSFNYAMSSSGLHTSGQDYKTVSAYSLGRNNRSISNGGKGGPHPYLTGINIPSYVGPCDPNDCGWVDEVLSLRNIINMTNASPIKPGDNIPPTAPGGIGIKVFY